MKNLKMFFAVLLTVVTLSHSKPSHAVASAFTGGVTAAAGLTVMGVGVGVGVVGMAAVYSDCVEIGCIAAIVPAGIGAAIALVGLIMLEGEQRIEFKPVSANDAHKIGLSSAERESFNDELDQANTLLEQVASEITQSEDATPEHAAQIWAGYQSMVNPLTFSAMQKIASQK
jgi:hypothetical protein